MKNGGGKRGKKGEEGRGCKNERTRVARDTRRAAPGGFKEKVTRGCQPEWLRPFPLFLGERACLAAPRRRSLTGSEHGTSLRRAGTRLTSPCSRVRNEGEREREPGSKKSRTAGEEGGGRMRDGTRE